MNVILQKTEEEHLLSTCDGTCKNGTNCKCVVDIGSELSGQAMYDYGFSDCLLCQRANGQQFCTIPDNYPVDWIYDGYKIRYDKSNYKLKNKNTIEHIIDTDLYEETWLSTLYYTSTSLISSVSVDWRLAVCDTSRCKHPIHAYIDVHRAIGVSHSYYDVVDRVVKCENCHKELRYIDSDNSIVEYKENKYTQCRFCSTVIIYTNGIAVQTCTTCTNNCKSDIQKGRHICLYCKNAVNINQRKNIQEFKIRKTPTSCTETVYLCRLHRVYPPDTSKIFKISELLSFF